MGGGAFLLAAARHLHATGHDARAILEDLLWGADLDPDAVTVARAALRTWGAEHGADVAPRHLVVGDTLATLAGTWPDRPEHGFDVVVGNPPFLSPLDASTRRPAPGEALGALLGGAPVPYVDAAAVFLLAACVMAAPDGRVVLIVPESVLAARDAGPVRRSIAGRAALVGLWWGRDAIFDAGVQVCAPVLQLGRDQSATCRLWLGADVEPAGTASADRAAISSGASWGPLLARLRGVPASDLGSGPTLATIATATAGFREQFYGVAPFVSDATPALTADQDPDPGTVGSGNPAETMTLMTAGLIDPLRSRWGHAPARFGGRAWSAPVVDLGALAAADGTLAAWATERRVAKVVMATQTRVIEVAVDTEGSWWPSVPTVAVTPTSPGPEALWRLAAVLSAPPVSAWALTHFGGTALSADAIKLSARQILTIPVPLDEAAWARGAVEARAAHDAARAGRAGDWRAALGQLGRTMTAAYGADADVLAWWEERLPPWR